MAAWSLDLRESEDYASHVACSYFRVVPIEAVEMLVVRRGERVLDAACGAGLAASEASARGARAFALDLSGPMLRVASRRSRSDQVQWIQGDLHAMPIRDGSFDAVACPHGLMFMDRPETALVELMRVLKDGGRIVATTWGGPDANPHERALVEAFEAEGHERPPFFDSLFSLADERTILALASFAGLVDVRVERVRRVVDFPTRASYWRGMTAGRPLGRLLGAFSRAQTERVRLESLSRMKPYAHASGYRSPMEALFLVGRKAEGA